MCNLTGQTSSARLHLAGVHGSNSSMMRGLCQDSFSSHTSVYKDCIAASTQQHMLGGYHTFKRDIGLQMSSAQGADPGWLLCIRDQSSTARLHCGGCQMLESTLPLCSCLAAQLAAWMPKGLAQYLGSAMLAAHLAFQHCHGLGATLGMGVNGTMVVCAVIGWDAPQQALCAQL